MAQIGEPDTPLAYAHPMPDLQPSTPPPDSAGPPAEPGCGVFVVFEGGDGAGKTTQISRLAEVLRGEGRAVLTTREPGGTDLGVEVRRMLLHGGEVTPEAEALLFAADRAQHVTTLIRPALAQGQVVISDRYVDSTLAYQGARAQLSEESLRMLARFATGGLVPHLTVLLDISPSLGRSRRGEEDDRIESAPTAFHEAVRAAFLRLAQASPDRYLVVDAARSVDEIAEAVAGRVRGLLAGVDTEEVSA